jgi:hypothetical protein
MKDPDDSIRAPGIKGPLLGNEGPREPYKSPYPDGLPGHQATEPSIEAAEAWLEKAGKLQRRVYAEIKASGDQGATLAELHQIIGGSPHTMSPRVDELRKQNLVVESGETRNVRETCPNCDYVLHITRPQTVWKARWRT